MKTASNPGGIALEVFDGMRAAVQADRSQWNKDVTMPYYNCNRPNAVVSDGVREDYWRRGMATGLLAAYYAIAAFSETDFTEGDPVVALCGINCGVGSSRSTRQARKG